MPPFGWTEQEAREQGAPVKRFSKGQPPAAQTRLENGSGGVSGK